jgi:hypothetical protein
MLLLLLVFGQSLSLDNNPKSTDYKILKTDVVNSQNYQFSHKFVSELVPKFSKKPIILVEKEGSKVKETEVGEVVCLQLGNDNWLMAKAVINQSVPKDYVMRGIFKITESSMTSGCNFVVNKGEINKFVLISPLFASTFP